MHHFIAKFSKNFLRLRRQGGIDPPQPKSCGRPWLNVIVQGRRQCVAGLASSMVRAADVTDDDRAVY